MWNSIRCVAWYAAMLFLVALLINGCATSPSSQPNVASSTSSLAGVVTGNASYRERVALLPGAVMRVTLEDVSMADAAATVIAETIIQPERQVPIPFTLPYDPARIDPSHRYAIRVRIENEQGGAMWATTQHYGVITQGNPDHVDVLLEQVRNPGKAEAAPSLLGRTYAYNCDGFAFTMRNGTEQVTLYLPDRYVVLPQVMSGSGVRYQEGDIEFWSKGEEAMLTVGAKRYVNCKIDQTRSAVDNARLHMVHFRAVTWFLWVV
jgi:putative lipoprotein